MILLYTCSGISPYQIVVEHLESYYVNQDKIPMHLTGSEIIILWQVPDSEGMDLSHRHYEFRV